MLSIRTAQLLLHHRISDERPFRLVIIMRYVLAQEFPLFQFHSLIRNTFFAIERSESDQWISFRRIREHKPFFDLETAMKFKFTFALGKSNVTESTPNRQSDSLRNRNYIHIREYDKMCRVTTDPGNSEIVRKFGKQAETWKYSELESLNYRLRFLSSLCTILDLWHSWMWYSKDK